MKEPKLYGLLVRFRGCDYRVTGFNSLKGEYSLCNLDTLGSAFATFEELEREGEIIGKPEK